MKRAVKHSRRLSPSNKVNNNRPLFNERSVIRKSDTDNNEQTAKDTHIPKSTASSKTESLNDLRLLQLYFKEN